MISREEWCQSDVQCICSIQQTPLINYNDDDDDNDDYAILRNYKDMPFVYLPITPHLHLPVVRQRAPRLNEQL